MDIPQLGSLHAHPKITKWLVSEPIKVPYFDGLQLAFILKGLAEEDVEDAKKAVESFLSLGVDARLRASSYIFLNYRRIVDAIGEEDVDCPIKSHASVWAHVHPTEIYVSRRRRRDQLIYIQIAAECDWEPEHGLQIIYRKGNELSRVSDQDGHLTHTDAFNVPEDQDKIA